MECNRWRPRAHSRRGSVEILSVRGILACAAVVVTVSLLVGFVMDLPGAIRQSRELRLEEARELIGEARAKAAAEAARSARLEAEARANTVASATPAPPPVVEPQKQQAVAMAAPVQPKLEPALQPTVPEKPPESPEELFPGLVDGLTLPQLGSKPTKIATIRAAKNAALEFEMLSPKLLREGRRFSVRPNGDGWLVEAVQVNKKGAPEGDSTRLATLAFATPELRFAWLDKVDPKLAEQLQDCGLRFALYENSAIAALRPAQVHKPLPLDFKKDSMQVAIANSLWDGEGVALNLEALNIEGGVGYGLAQMVPSSGRVKLNEPLQVVVMPGAPGVVIRLTLLFKAGAVTLKVEPLFVAPQGQPAPLTKARVERLARTYGIPGFKDSLDQFMDNATLSFRVFYSAGRTAEAEIVRYGERQPRPPGMPF